MLFRVNSNKKKENDEQLLFRKGLYCSKKDGKLSFKINGILSERIKDLKFLLELHKNQENILTVGSYYKAEFEKDCFLKEVENYQQDLAYMEMLDSELKSIGFTEELECDNLTKSDEYNIEIFLKSVILDNALISENGMPIVLNIQVANIIFPVLTE